jgi:dTDP-4-amino-4,6-dideoxygalactose transaminase
MSQQLAILGGPKAVSSPAPHYTWPLVTEKTEQAVIRQIREAPNIYDRSGIFERLENRWSAYHGRKHSLLTNSGTTALWSMFEGANLGPGDEVICPAYTFYATCTPLFFTGATPVLCDSDVNGNLDPAAAEKLVTERTKAVLITHMWGIPCQMEALTDLCKRRCLLLLEDSSHAHGARLNGRLCGTFGDAAVWSLGGQKIITGGEGGILSTDNPEIHARALILGQYNKRCHKEIAPDNPLHRFAMTGKGLKFRASPLNAAMADEQFDHLQEWLDQKRKFAALFTERLSGLPGLRTPVVPAGAEPSWYSFVMRYHAEELGGLPIERFHAALVAEGCRETNLPTSTCPLNWLPLFQQPGELFRQYAGARAYAAGDFPAAELFARQAITMPVWARQEDQPIVEQYAAAIVKVIASYKELL